jgi:hypothetical protein
MSTSHWVGAAVVATVAALPLFAVHAEAPHETIGALTARCRVLITEFDHQARVAPSSANKRVWQLRAQGADECFGDDSSLYPMRFGIADLAQALRSIGGTVPVHVRD